MESDCIVKQTLKDRQHLGISAPLFKTNQSDIS